MTPCRGRPRKLGKLKVPHAIVATGKGRGRPKNPKKAALLKKVAAVKKKSLGRGRPRKEKASSENENSSCDEKPDYEERRGVGRPSTGAVNLNIVRTGRGQGRPKKKKTEAGLVGSVTKSSKKCGRPYQGGVPYVPTGKPRGRPKSNQNEPTNNNKDQLEEQACEEVVGI
uniref:Chromosomal protein D1 n=1 Tax=Ceratitis capitata TaxID=7213 RepID=W8C7Y2_CERCA